MAAPASNVLSDVQSHLQTLINDPSVPLDVNLLEQAEIYVSTPTYLSQEWQRSGPVFQQVAQVLPALQQDPTPLIRLIMKLAAPFSYDHMSDLDLTPALALEAKPFHDLALTLLGKATANAVSAEMLAAKPELLQGVVRIWLSTDDIGIASKAGKLLLDLLTVSKNAPEALQTADAKQYGRGPVWKRLFEDADVYRLLFAYCSTKPLGGDQPKLTAKERTIAQSRLMEWLPKVGALDWTAIRESQVPAVEAEAGLPVGSGLLDFVATQMVDYENDILMGISLLQFYSDLVASIKQMASTNPNTSVSLQYLLDTNLHSRAMDYWLRPENFTSMEHTFLSGPSAHYLSSYLSHYPDHFEHSAHLPEVRKRLMSALDLSSHQWSHGQSPKHDLNVLSSLPRTVLLAPEGIQGTPLARVPPQTINTDALHTLATIFHGPLPPVEVYPPIRPTLDVSITEARQNAEKAAAQTLFTQYLALHPNLFRTLANHAQTLALKETALAAINLIKAIATANWPSPPPAADAAHSYSANDDRPSVAGVRLLLTHPAIAPHLIPFLLAPSPSYSGLAGLSRTDDADSAAHAVASAKFDLVAAIAARVRLLRIEMPAADPAWDRLRQVALQLQRRLGEGVWGAGANVGGRIGTLEM